MAAKHLTKNIILHKYVFLAVAIAFAIVAAFLTCATSQANAELVSDKNECAVYVSEDSSLVGPFHKMTSDEWTAPNETTIASFGQWGESEEEIISALADGAELESILVSQLESVNPFTGNDCLVLSIKLIKKSDSYYKKAYYYMDINKGFEWTIDNYKFSDSDVSIPINDTTRLSFTNNIINKDFNVSGVVTDANGMWSPVAGAFVQYCHLTPWGAIPVPGLSTFTDWFGHYTIEGIEEDNLPGVIRVYRWGYEVGESWDIWFVPEGIDTIYRPVLMTPAEPPVPPVPPTPPDPPVPPTPPTPPVPPQPVPPTPVDPGTNVPQTGDSTAIALAIASILALCGASGFTGSAKTRRKNK